MGRDIDPPGLQRPARRLHGPVLPGHYQEFLPPAAYSIAVRIASSLAFPVLLRAPVCLSSISSRLDRGLTPRGTSAPCSSALCVLHLVERSAAASVRSRALARSRFPPSAARRRSRG